MSEIKVGDKVRTKPNASRQIAGCVVCIHPETVHGHSACASVYCGGYESIKVPLSDLEKTPLTLYREALALAAIQSAYKEV
jgi:hypothetical protein